MTFKPDVTVAAVVERDGRFLVVEERAGRRIVINQPAGHLESGESLVEAVVRETLEETAYRFEPEHLLGLYLWRDPVTDRSFLRVAFTGSAAGPEPGLRLDRCIVRAAWLSREQLSLRPHSLRSPMVMRCVDDYLRGVRHPLSLLNHLGLEDPSTRAVGT